MEAVNSDSSAKKHNAQTLDDFSPVALKLVMKCFEKIIKRQIMQKTPLDPLQFAYRTKRGMQWNAVATLLHLVLQP